MGFDNAINSPFASYVSCFDKDFVCYAYALEYYKPKPIHSCQMILGWKWIHNIISPLQTQPQQSNTEGILWDKPSLFGKVCNINASSNTFFQTLNSQQQTKIFLTDVNVRLSFTFILYGGFLF